MPVDASEIIRRLRGDEGGKFSVSIYVDKALFKAFKKNCDGFSASKVLEELMRDFLRSKKVSWEKSE